MEVSPAKLRVVNVSRPDITKSPSQQSIAASDDYYSLSDRNGSLSSASNASSAKHSETTVVRWGTPPSYTRSPVTSREHLPVPASPPVRTPSPRRFTHPSPLQSAPVTEEENDFIPKRASVPASFGSSSQRTIPRKPAPATVRKDVSSIRRISTAGNRDSVTPGVDDTPFYRYALDSITRGTGGESEDERRYSRHRSAASTDEISPIHPDYASDRSDPSRGSIQRSIDITQTAYTPIPPKLVHADPPRNSFRYPQLNYVPFVLRPLSLVVIILLHLVMIAALIFSGIWSIRHNGLWNYDGSDGARYFVFEFLPQILAGILLILILVVQTALTRLLPFLSLASGRGTGSSALMLELFPRNFALPNLSAFRSGYPVIGAILLAFWISIFALPFQSAVFQVHPMQVGPGNFQWRWVAVQPIVWLLVGIYALSALGLATLAIFLFRRETGLLWDARSLADIFCLLHSSNTLDTYESLEATKDRSEFTNRLSLKSNRLSYWTTDEEKQELFYAIGEEGARSKRSSAISARTARTFDQNPTAAQRGSTTTSLQTQIYSPSVRYRYIPWFLRDTFVVAWSVTVVVLLAAFLIVSFLHRAVQDGFSPLIGVSPTPVGFSAAGFLYSFIPGLIGLGLFLFWQSIDMHFRALQPYANLSTPKGTNAENSLLLEYTATLPIETTLKAAIMGHWRVAWTSFMSLASLALPILAGGVFWAIYFPQTKQVRMVAQMPAFYALCAFVVLYALSFPLAIWPGRKRYLPHSTRSLAEISSFVYQSPLLDDPTFRDPRNRIDLVTRLLYPRQMRPWPLPSTRTDDGASDSSARAGNKFAFGIYVGQDGREHLGIDRLHRPRSDMIVTTAGLK